MVDGSKVSFPLPSTLLGRTFPANLLRRLGNCGRWKSNTGGANAARIRRRANTPSANKKGTCLSQSVPAASVPDQQHKFPASEDPKTLYVNIGAWISTSVPDQWGAQHRCLDLNVGAWISTSVPGSQHRCLDLNIGACILTSVRCLTSGDSNVSARQLAASRNPKIGAWISTSVPAS